MITLLEKKGIITQEIFIHQWLIKAPEEAEIAVPKGLDRYKSVLIDYLKKHNGQMFVHESIQQLFEMSTEQTDSLAKILEEKGIIHQVEMRHGVLNKEKAFAGKLPENLQKFQDILSSWIQKSDQESDITAYYDSLPLPKDAEEGCRHMLNYLIGEEVIKEPVLIFPKIKDATTNKIESELERIRQVIKELNIEPLYRKYCPAPAAAADDYKPGLSDAISYIRANLSAIVQPKYALFAGFTACDSNWAMDEFLEKERMNIKAWLKETKEKEALDAYVNQVVMAVTGSAGQLKTLPASIFASFRNLDKYFTSGRYPPEVDDFEVQLLDRVIVLKEYKSWWDWRAFTVAMIGVLQITAGVAINYISAGVLSPIGNAFIAEGLNDIIFAIQTGLTGTFSWSSYGKQKMITAGFSILTAGIATYFTWSAAVAKTAAAGFRARCGLKMLYEAGKRVMRKIGQAVRSALIALGVEKLMTFLKKLIVENILDYFRSNLIGKASMGAVKTLSEAMDKIWKSTDGDVKESKRLIETTILVDAAASDMHSTWLNQLSAHSTHLGRAMGNTFAESCQEFKYQSDFLDGIGSAQLDAGNSTGLEMLNFAKDLVDTGQKVAGMIEATNGPMKWIELLKTGAEVATIITHTPEYINGISRQLENQAHSLEITKESSRNTPEVSEDFENFKSEMKTKVERDVLEHVVSRINSAWLQPLVQRKVEGIVKSLGKTAVQLIGSLFEDDQEGLRLQRERVGKEETDKKASSQNNRKKNRSHGQQQPNESYTEQVNSIGQGQPAGLLEFQQVVDYLGVPMDIDDETETLTPNSKDEKKFTVKPNGRESAANAPRMRLKMSQNADGKKHVSLTDDNGDIVYDGPADGLNRCLYDAAARFKGVSTEDFITGLKSHALNNERARYYWIVLFKFELIII